jgi:hypothetical protein
VLRQMLDHFDKEEADDATFKTISPQLHGLLGLCISAKLDLFAGAISTFDLHDDVDKWEDMYTPKNVQSMLHGDTAQYSYRLARVLKAQPYGTQETFQNIAMPAAVYDYGCVALMVDISKSFVSLARLVKELLKPAAKLEDVYSKFVLVVAQVYERNADAKDGIHSELKKKNEAVKDKTPHHDLKFIQHTSSWRRAAIRLQEHDTADLGLTGATSIDNLAGYYWGARPCGVEQFNHQYLACPTLKIDPQTDTPVLNRLQAISHKGGHVRRVGYATELLTTLHRNSLYVRSVCQTLAKMIAILKPHWGGTAIRPDAAYVLRPDPNKDLAEVHAFDGDIDIGELPAGGAPLETKAYTLADFQRRLKAETDALDASIKQARSATSYPGISWPVVYGNDPRENNFRAFERVHAIPRPTPPIAESVDKAAIAMEMIARANLAGREGEAIVHNVAARVEAQQEEGEVH